MSVDVRIDATHQAGGDGALLQQRAGLGQCPETGRVPTLERPRVLRMKLLTQLLLDLSMNLPPEDVELADLIVAETRRILKLLEQVEQFGNLRPPEARAVNIHDVLDRARRSALLGFAAHMTILEDYDPSLPPTVGDPDQLLQVLLNLLKNAAEASGGKPGTIRLHTFYDHSLRLRRVDGAGTPLPLQIEIIDDGPGIPPEIAESIFDPFVSGRENGTGLGLALVSKIVADHDGWITADSVPGRTVFRLSLPVAPRTAAPTPKEKV